MVRMPERPIFNHVRSQHAALLNQAHLRMHTLSALRSIAPEGVSFEYDGNSLAYRAFMPGGHLNLPTPVSFDIGPYAQNGNNSVLFSRAAKAKLSVSCDDEAIVYRWADKLAKDMIRDRHFTLDEKKQKIELKSCGNLNPKRSQPPPPIEKPCTARPCCLSIVR